MLILETLAETATVDSSATTRDLCGLFARHDNYTTLHTSVPLASRTLYQMTMNLRQKHINIQNSLHMEQFAHRFLNTRTMKRVTRLEVTIDTPQGFTSLAAVLLQLSQLETLAVQDRGTSPQARSMSGAPDSGGLPDAFVDAVSTLTTLRVLVLLPQATAVTRDDVARICRGTRRLLYLHIPATIRAGRPRSVEETNIPLNLRFLRTLSAGRPGRRQSSNIFQEVLKNAECSYLERLNVVGVEWTPLHLFQSTLGNVRHLETISSNRKIWDAFAFFHACNSRLPRVETIEMHLDDWTGYLGTGLPHLEVITVLDDLFEEEGEAKRDRLTTVLRSILRLKEGSRLLRRVSVFTTGAMPLIQEELDDFVGEYRKEHVILSFKTRRAFTD